MQRANPAYSASLDEFKAASAASTRNPVTIRQRDVARQFQDSLQRCPQGKKKVGCETSEKDRAAMAKELGELSEVIGAGAGAIREIHARMEAAEKALPGYAEFTAHRTALRNDIDRSEAALKDARAQIVSAFPAYTALADPKPLRVAEVQELLNADEALIAILVGSSKSFVWVLTRERAEWAEIDAGAQALLENVQALRNGLDPLAQQDSEATAGSQAGVVGSFDLARAHALYQLVLAPVAGVFAGKRHLILVPTGPLTSLPLQVLVTEPPLAGAPPSEALRDAAWLIKGYALSVLPSVQSLSALRKLPGGTAAARPFFGMGDPVLKGPDPADRQRGAKRRSITAPAGFYRNGRADIGACARIAAATRYRHRAQNHRQGARCPARCRLSARGGNRDPPQIDASERLSHHRVCYPWARCRRPVRTRRAGAGVDPAGRADGHRRRIAHGLGDRRLETQRGLGGAVRLQYGGRWRRGSGGAFGSCSRFLLCRRAGAARVALGGLFDGCHGAHHQDFRNARRRAGHRPRGSLPPGHARPNRGRQAARLLGAVRGRRRGRPERRRQTLGHRLVRLGAP